MSSNSSRSKYAKKMFEELIKKGIAEENEVNKVISMPELLPLIYKNYKKTLKHLVDGISLENLNLECLALNHRMPKSLIKELIKLIGNNNDKLKEFYNNLVKNEYSILNTRIINDIIKLIGNDKSALNDFYNNLAKNKNLAKKKNFNVFPINKYREYFKSSNPADFGIVLKTLCASENPEVIKLLIDIDILNHADILNNADFVYWLKTLCASQNPEVIQLLLKDILNPKMIKLLKEKLDPADFGSVLKTLCASQNPEVIKLLKDLLNPADFGIVLKTLCASQNPEVIQLLTDIMNDYNHEDWGRHLDITTLSANPTTEAITLLRDGGMWDALSSNPHPEAIKLLRVQIDIERNYIEKPRQQTYTKERINWKKLSANTGAIELLINWEKISANTGAIELIIEKLRNEGSVPISQYDIKNKINKNKLSTNPAIFVKYDIPK
jgi:hypothetical protein